MTAPPKTRGPELPLDTPAPSAMVKTGEPPTRAPMVQADENGNISPSQLIMAAIERGIPPESLEKLVALSERMEDRNAEKAFIRELAKVKAEMPPIVHSKKAAFKTRTGHDVKYSYTELDELARILDPILARHGFSYSWSQSLDKGMVTTTCRLEHEMGHSRSSPFTVPAESDSAASPQQKIGIADTYAARRSLIGVLGLTTADKDPRPAEMDQTPINDDQVLHLEDLLKETKGDRVRFLKFLGVEKLEELPAVRYQEAINALEQKKARAK